MQSTSALSASRASSGIHGRFGWWPLLPAIILIVVGTAGMWSARVHALETHILLAMRHPADPSQLLGPHWLQQLLTDFSGLGGIGVLVVFIGASLVILWLVGRRTRAYWFLGGVVGAFIIASVLKHVVARPRPELIPHEAYTFTASFPSGNTLMATVVWLLIALAVTELAGQRLARWFAVAVALLIALLVGVSRVYMGVHWPTDVLAAWGIGIAWIWLWRRVQPVRGLNAPR